MNDVSASSPVPRDVSFDLHDVRVFASLWEPAAAARSTKAPILLLHDSLGCVALWRDFPAALAARTSRSVLAYDRVGFGRSSAHPGSLDRSFVAEEARTTLPALREHLAIDRFVAFGHSVGGGMAVHIAAAFPEACVALITESAQAFVEDRTLEGIREAKAGFQHADQLARIERYHGAKARWVVDAWTETWLSPEFASWSLDAVLPKVSCPLLAMHGEHDEFGSSRHPERIAGLVRGPAQCEILSGLRHVPHREDDARVLALVASFLDGVP